MLRARARTDSRPPTRARAEARSREPQAAAPCSLFLAHLSNTFPAPEAHGAPPRALFQPVSPGGTGARSRRVPSLDQDGRR
jgi:hypothetical protein